MQLHKMLHEEKEAGGPGAEVLVMGCFSCPGARSSPGLGAHVACGSDARAQAQVSGLMWGLDKVLRVYG